MKTNASTSARNPAIELYRVALMFLIVLHHAGVHGYWKDDTTYWSIPILFSLCSVWHVDGFLSITGWFGTSFTLMRYLKLWGVVAFYSCLSTLYRYLSTGVFRPSLAGGWFVCAFMFFLMISPLLNLAINAVHERRMIWIWALFDVAVLLTWLPYNLLSFVGGGVSGYSVLTFVVVYVNVRLLRLFEVDKLIRPMHIIAALLSFAVCAFCVSVMPGILKLHNGGIMTHMGWVCRSTYLAPYVVLMSIAMLMLFVKFIKPPEFINKLVLLVAPAMFGVYVLHDATLFGHDLFLVRPQSYIVSRFGFHPVIVVFLYAIICFVSCVAIDLTRRCFAKWIVRLIAPRINFIDARCFK